MTASLSTSRKLSPSEPVSQLRCIPIVECGEPLVDYTQTCPELLVDRSRFEYRRETLLRQRVAEMLCRADELLPAGYRLAVVEGWRPLHIQARMYRAIYERIQASNPHWSPVKLRRVVNRYSAPIDRRVPPPHSTGGALDVFLADEAGEPVDLSSPFEPHDAAGLALAAPGLSEAAREHRGIMAQALTGAGLTNYPSEFWHWSYGDQGWAYRTGQPAAIYGGLAPPGWTPDPADVHDGPLVFVEHFAEDSEAV